MEQTYYSMEAQDANKDIVSTMKLAGSGSLGPVKLVWHLKFP